MFHAYSRLGAYQSIMLCKIGRYWNPSLMNGTIAIVGCFSNLIDLRPTRAALIELVNLIPRVVTAAMVDEMMLEMPNYLALARDFQFAVESMKDRARECERFWMAHKLEIPGTYRLFRIVALFTASSGAAERLLSFFVATVGTFVLVFQ